MHLYNLYIIILYINVNTNKYSFNKVIMISHGLFFCFIQIQISYISKYSLDMVECRYDWLYVKYMMLYNIFVHIFQNTTIQTTRLY